MSEFIPNPGFFAELQAEAEFVAFMERLARKAEEVAKSIAPVGDPAEDPHSGRFRDSMHGHVVREGGKTVARLETDDEDWVYIEFGTEDTPAHATLRQTLDRLT